MTSKQDNLRGLVNISTFIEDPDVSLEDIEKMSFRTTGRTNLMTRLVHKFFYNQQKEGKMKVNVEIAKICHEANRQYCKTNNLTEMGKWEDYPKEFQDFWINEVIITNHKTSAKEVWQRWFDNKSKEGWKYAKKMDVKNKLHPNMVPWEKLSEVERGKYNLFLATVRREMKA